MLTEERFAAILEELRMKNAVSVTELVEKLGASESTIRRDLNTRRRYGERFVKTGRKYWNIITGCREKRSVYRCCKRRCSATKDLLYG